MTRPDLDPHDKTLRSRARSRSDLLQGATVDFEAARVTLLAAGACYIEEADLLAVSDLHLGKSERAARRGGPLLPPYETMDTLERLSDLIEALSPKRVACLGDSFDDSHALVSLRQEDHAALSRLAAGREWIWIAGNHDPQPTALAGESCFEIEICGIALRHAAAEHAPSGGEMSGHYHPKATLTVKGRSISRRCFLCDDRRLILPAFGAYTGGLDVTDTAFDRIFPNGATAHMLSANRTLAVSRRCSSRSQTPR